MLGLYGGHNFILQLLTHKPNIKPWSWCSWFLLMLMFMNMRLKAGVQVTHQKNNDGCLPRRAWRLIKNRSFGISAFLHVCAMAWLQLVSQNRRSCSFIGFVWNNFDVFMESPHILTSTPSALWPIAAREVCAQTALRSATRLTLLPENDILQFDPCVFCFGFDISFVLNNRFLDGFFYGDSSRIGRLGGGTVPVK